MILDVRRICLQVRGQGKRACVFKNPHGQPRGGEYHVEAARPRILSTRSRTSNGGGGTIVGRVSARYGQGRQSIFMEDYSVRGRNYGGH